MTTNTPTQATKEKRERARIWKRAQKAAACIVKDYIGLKIGDGCQEIMTEQLYFRLLRELYTFGMHDWPNSDSTK